MTTVDFALNGFAYYEHEEHHEALYEKQGFVRMRPCKAKRKRKTV